MIRRILSRAAALPLLATALLSACADNGPTYPAATPPPVARMAVIPTPLVSIDGGESHACGLTSAGQAWCWGRNAVGTLGDSSATARSVPVQVRQQSGVTFTSLSAGKEHVCALTSAGQPWCWGYNSDYRLGDSTTSLGLAPVQVKGMNGVSFSSISAGHVHTCGLNSSGQAYCWGTNANGQLGTNSTAFKKTPVAVQHPSGVTFSSITAGEGHTCALDTTGQAWCWGYGGYGSNGAGFSFVDSIPVAVTHPSGVTFTSLVTEDRHTCALTSAGQAYCWGPNSNGQLGDNTTTTRYTPVAVQQPSGVTFTSLTMGWSHTCGLTSGGQAYCWGYNTRGTLGDGTATQRKVPTAVSQSSVTFASIAAQGYSTCALNGSGTLYCWGRNDYYQVADGTTTDRYAPVTGDDAPAVSSTSPANGGTNVAASANITINFTESVTVSTSSFTLSCNSTSQSFSVSGSGTSSITLDPVNLLPALNTCTVTVIAAQVTDTDTNDGVDNMEANHAFSFQIRSEFGGDT